jgi:hypothetical protein
MGILKFLRQGFRPWQTQPFQTFRLPLPSTARSNSRQSKQAPRFESRLRKLQPLAAPLAPQAIPALLGRLGQPGQLGRQGQRARLAQLGQRVPLARPGRPDLLAPPAPQELRAPLELRALPAREPEILALRAPQAQQELLGPLEPLELLGQAIPGQLVRPELQVPRAPQELPALLAIPVLLDLQAIPARRALLVRVPEILAPRAIPGLQELQELQELPELPELQGLRVIPGLQELQGLRVIPEPLGPLGLRAPPEQREILALPGLLARQARQATLGPLDRLARPVRLGLQALQAIRAPRDRLFIPALVWLFRTALLGSRLSLRPQVRSSAPQTRRR